jgi:hypothetical protein
MKSKPRIRVSVFVDPELDKTIEHLAVDLNKKKYELYELGAKILVELVTMGNLSEETKAAIAGMQRQAKARAELAVAPSA